MKVLFVSHYSALYGANKSLLNLIDGLRKLHPQLDLCVICPKGDLANKLRTRKIKIVTIPFFNEVGLIKTRNKLLKGFVKMIINACLASYLFFLFKYRKPQIIHTNTSVTFLGAYLAFLLRSKHIWHIREYGTEDYNLVYCFGNSYFKFWLKKSAGVIAISKSIAKRRLNMPLPKKVVVANGVVFEEDLRLTSKLRSTTLTFGIVGLLSPNKNQLEALKAFNIFVKTHPDSKLFIIGGPSDRIYATELFDFVKANGLEGCVNFTGYQIDVNNYYKQIDVLLMCSRNEALGRVTIEAMSHGVAVIGFDNGGTAEIIENGINGLLYAGDHSNLLSKMMYLVKEEGLKEQIIKNAMDKVRSNYTVETYTSGVISFYQKCITHDL